MDIELNQYPEGYNVNDIPQGELLNQLLNFPKNTLEKEELQNWEKMRKVKEAFERLEGVSSELPTAEDFQLFKRICFRKWMVNPYVSGDSILNNIDQGTPLKAFILLAQQLVICQINSDIKHYLNMQPPKKKE